MSSTQKVPGLDSSQLASALFVDAVEEVSKRLNFGNCEHCPKLMFRLIAIPTQLRWLFNVFIMQ